MTKKFEIRNSTAEFLTFVAENKEDGVQVFYKDETIWATQQAIATLFDIFVCSMSDLFHKDVPFEFIDKVMATIEATP